MLQNNVTVTEQGIIRAIMLTPKLRVKQLHNNYAQKYGNGDLSVIVEHLKGKNPSWSIYKCTDNGFNLKVSKRSAKRILSQLSPDLKKWLESGKTKTLPDMFRPTTHTVEQQRHISRMKEIFAGQPVPARLKNLILDHRNNTDWWRGCDAPRQDIKLLGKMVRAAKSVIELPDIGKRYSSTTSWLVFYSDKKAMYLDYSSNNVSRSLDLTNAVHAVSFTHSAHATDNLPWLKVDMYGPSMSR